MIKLQLMLIYDTGFVTSQLFWKSFNLRYNPRMNSCRSVCVYLAEWMSKVVFLCFYKIACLLVFLFGSWKSRMQRRKVGIPLTGWTLPHFLACSKPGSWEETPTAQRKECMYQLETGMKHRHKMGTRNRLVQDTCKEKGTRNRTSCTEMIINSFHAGLQHWNTVNL